MPGPFAAGDRVLLVDTKRRRRLVTLEKGATLHSHAGTLAHDDVIGRPEGVRVATAQGLRYTVVRPTLSDYVLEMPRGAQVIYPKDLGPILVLADVFPGARVFESGMGSGALTAALLRAVGPAGHVTGYEIRPDFAERAQRNVAGFLGDDVPLTVEVRDCYDGIAVEALDRVLLDLPEPWRVVDHARAALRPGGILLSYLPTIGQVTRLREELASSAFGMADTVEVLQRHWHVEGASVRPDHRMVAHTGFLTHARLLGDGDDAAPVNQGGGDGTADADGGTLSDA
ncbi:MAG: tRNA (adenine-N1)-methyltransferase [Acidimicrobiia bacterium]